MPGEPPADETSRVQRTVILALFAIKQGLMAAEEVQVGEAASSTSVQVARVPDQDLEGPPIAIAGAAGLHGLHVIQAV